jgi:hypothetical protein
MSAQKSRQSIRFITAGSIFALVMAASPAFAMTDANMGGGGASPGPSVMSQIASTANSVYQAAEPVVARVLSDLQTVVFVYQVFSFFGAID